MEKMTDKLRKMINIAKKLNDTEYRTYKSILRSAGANKTDIQTIDKHYAVKNKIVEQGSIRKNLTYSQDMDKIIKIINNKSLIDKIGGVKVLLYGPTGTGKTTFVNKVAELCKNYKFENIQLEEYVSSKMGQTQINLINLANNLNNGVRKIVFIDELDAVISSRIKSNDVGEHSRIVATFIKFLDRLSTDVILFTATNILDSIDEAVKRRFPIKLRTNTLSADKFFDEFVSESKHIFTTQLSNTLKSIYDGNKFSYADLKYLEDFFDVEAALEKKVDPFLVVLKSLSSKKINQTSIENLSKKKRDTIMKVVESE